MKGKKTRVEYFNGMKEHLSREIFEKILFCDKFVYRVCKRYVE